MTKQLIAYSKLNSQFRIFDNELLYKTFENLIRENVNLDRFEMLNPSSNEYLGESLEEEETFIADIADVLEYEVLMEDLRDIIFRQTQNIEKEIKFQWMINNESFVNEVFSDTFEHSDHWFTYFARFSYRIHSIEDLSLLEIANEAVDKYVFSFLIDAFYDIFPTIKRQFGIENYSKSQN